MIIYTAKFSKKKAVAILFAVAIVIAAVILASPEKQEAGQDAFAESNRVRSAEDVCVYISSLGYTADSESAESRQVTIPEKFDEVYENYNAMQKECGFDLTRYRGREATLYTCALTDYPGCEEKVLCDVLVCRDKVIGGNIYTLALDGFMHGLKPAED